MLVSNKIYTCCFFGHRKIEETQEKNTSFVYPINIHNEIIHQEILQNHEIINENANLPEDEEASENYITLTDDNGEDVSFEMLGTVEYQDRLFAVLIPFDEDDLNTVDRCLEVTVEVHPWKVVLVTPEF